MLRLAAPIIPLLLAIILAAPAATAQNTGGVFGPVVNDGHQSAQYRATYAPDSEALAQRIHYQRAFNGSKMWRVIAAARKTNDSDVDFDFVQAELFWQLSDDSAAWQTGVRFDARIRSEGRPGQLGANWMNQWTVAPDTIARFLVLTSIDVGDDARDGIFLQTRGLLSHALDSGPSVGLELFNAYGSTSDIADLDDQSHTIGPFISFPVGNGFSLYGGAQIGLTDGSPDEAVRLWLTKGF